MSAGFGVPRSHGSHVPVDQRSSQREGVFSVLKWSRRRSRSDLFAISPVDILGMGGWGKVIGEERFLGGLGLRLRLRFLELGLGLRRWDMRRRMWFIYWLSVITHWVWRSRVMVFRSLS